MDSNDFQKGILNNDLKNKMVNYWRNGFQRKPLEKCYQEATELAEKMFQ